MKTGATLEQHLDLVEALLAEQTTDMVRRKREFVRASEAVSKMHTALDFQAAAEERMRAALRLVRAREAWHGINAEAGRTRMAIIEREGRKFT